jgi:hypothetical protein
MFKLILIFLLLTTFIYCNETNLILNSKDNIIFIKCNNKYNLNINAKEEKEVKFGQEVFDNYKKTEKNLKKQLNEILIPDFMSKNFKIDLDIDKIKNLKIAYIYNPEQIKGFNLKVEWDKNLKLSSSFKTDFDISILIENVSEVVSNTFIPK